MGDAAQLHSYCCRCCCCWKAVHSLLALAYCARLTSWTVIAASCALVALSNCGRVAAGSLLSG